MCEPFLDILPKSTVNFDHAYLSTNGRSFNTALPRNYNDSCLSRTLTKIPKLHLISWCGNCAFQQNFYTRKLGKFPFFPQWYLLKRCRNPMFKLPELFLQLGPSHLSPNLSLMIPQCCKPTTIIILY